MRQALIAAGIAAVVSLVVWQVFDRSTPAEGATGPRAFRVTDELIEDGWVDGSRTAGADHKPLEHSASSICFLTKIEIKGVQGPEDANSCTIGIDEFTGYWQVTATVAEGGRSEVRCNARCLVWE